MHGDREGSLVGRLHIFFFGEGRREKGVVKTSG